MSTIETNSTSPITMPSGTFGTQNSLAFDAGFIQRLTLALSGTAEYIVNVYSSSSTNYADLAIFARMVAANPVYYAGVLVWLVAADGSITTASTDQALLNRVWTVWPVVSYKASTLLYPSTGA